MSHPSPWTRLRMWILVLVAATFLVMAGCSGGSSDGPTPTPTPEPTREVNLEFCAADEPIDADVDAACLTIPVRF